MRRQNLQSFVLVSLLFTCASPAFAQVYDIVINGATGFTGSAAIGSIFPSGSARRHVDTQCTPPLNNGVNPVDVGIFTTTASPLVGQAGALWFGTNTSLGQLVGLQTGGTGVDIAFVNFESATNRLFIAVDGNAFGLPAARLNPFNIYNVTTGFAAQIHNALTGMIEIQFSADFLRLSGTIFLGGNSGFAGPAVTSAYEARFTGTLRRQ